MTAIDVVVARQAIFDRRGGIFGYELLFRPVANDGTDGELLDGDAMTNLVIFSSVTMGIDRVVGDKAAFYNATRAVLVGAIPEMLPPERTVLEILESVTPDPEVLAACAQLKARGYRLALDDYTGWFEGADLLLELADIVKVDIREVPPEELPALVAECRRHRVLLLAEKIETDEELARCQELGFDYYQGFSLARPREVPGRALGVSDLGRIRIAASLLTSDFEVSKLEAILRAEPGMTYQLLQLAGVGARHGTRRRIRSVREALVMVGQRRLRSWVALLMVTRSESIATEDVVTALTRARMSELLVQGLSWELAGQAFTAGMLSAFDLLLGVPVEEVLRAMPLDEELHEAAFGEASPVGRVVQDVIDYLTGRADAPRRSGLSERDLALASGKALLWAMDAASTMAAAA